MDWKKINLAKYISEIKQRLNLKISEEIIEKDLLLTLILAEMEKKNLGKELIFKGGTLLSRNYLEYHRFSEDLDFVHKESGKLRDLPRLQRERRIKQFVNSFVPQLKLVADILGLEFSTDRSNIRFCKILHGRAVYIFKVYYSENKYVKLEINFVEKMHFAPIKISVKSITDFFDSEELLALLGLEIKNFNVLSYTLKEIVLEKYRAILTRKDFKERDLFDLFLIPDSFKADINEVLEKITDSSLIKRDLVSLIKAKLSLLNKGTFFNSEKEMECLAIKEYDKEEFQEFKEKIKPILIKICNKFLEKN